MSYCSEAGAHERLPFREVAAELGHGFADHRDVLADEVADGIDEGSRGPARACESARLSAPPAVNASSSADSGSPTLPTTALGHRSDLPPRKPSLMK